MIGLFSTNHGYIHAIRVNAARWCGERCAGAGVGDGDRCLHPTYTVRCCCLPLPSVPSSGAALLSLFCYTWYCNTCGTVNPKNYHRSPINIINKHLVCWCLGATSCQDTGIRGNNFYCSVTSFIISRRAKFVCYIHFDQCIYTKNWNWSCYITCPDVQILYTLDLPRYPSSKNSE